jgi:acetate kinase
MRPGSLDAHEWGEGNVIDHKTALHFIITWLEDNIPDLKVTAAGHRVVLGGTRFEAPVRVEGDVLDYLDSLAAIEPSHQTFNVRGARALAEAFPGLPQVACFDTMTHNRSYFHIHFDPKPDPQSGHYRCAASPNRAEQGGANPPYRHA